jgi:hypothetical protein
VLEGVEGWRVMELMRLHGLPIEATSRLSCQLIWDQRLDGLEVSLAGA